MRIRMFLENDDFTKQQEVIIDDENFHYLKNVLKVKLKEMIYLFNSNIEISFSVKEINKNNIILIKDKIIRNAEFISNFCLLQCIIKGEEMSRAISYAVQSGITEFIPIISQNCHIRDVNIERLKKISYSALEQSNGLKPMLIRNVQKLKNFQNESNSKVFFGDLSHRAQTIQEMKQNINLNEKIYILVGPEGGFSEEEIDYLYSKNFIGFCLGNRIFKSEIAGVMIRNILL